LNIIWYCDETLLHLLLSLKSVRHLNLVNARPSHVL